MHWKVYYKAKPINKTWIKCYEAKNEEDAEAYINSYHNTGMVFMLKRWNEGARRHLPVYEITR